MPASGALQYTAVLEYINPLILDIVVDTLSLSVCLHDTKEYKTIRSTRHDPQLQDYYRCGLHYTLAVAYITYVR